MIEVILYYVNRPGYGGTYGIEYARFRVRRGNEYLTEWATAELSGNTGELLLSGTGKIGTLGLVIPPPPATNTATLNYSFTWRNSGDHVCDNGTGTEVFSQSASEDTVLSLTLLGSNEEIPGASGNIVYAYKSNQIEVELCN